MKPAMGFPVQTPTERRQLRVPGLEAEALVCQDRESWLREREETYGASEVPEMLGVGYGSYFRRWAIRTGRLPEEDIDEKRSVVRGRILEPLAAQWYAEDTGRTLFDPGDYAIFRSPRHPLLHATLDRIIEPFDDRGPGVLEIKTSNSRQFWRWIDRPPDEVLIQIAVQMMVTGARWGAVACLMDEEIYHQDVERHPEFEERILTAVERFDWYVRKDREPKIQDGSEATRKAIASLYPGTGTGEWMQLSEEADELCETWLYSEREVAELEKAIGYAKNRLAQLVGPNRGGTTPAGRRISTARGVRWTNRKEERA